ncbi:sodium-translocating pyrophosphatase [Demequina sp.]|uniref:sodium-translocating pyrophosphatase n=1 Tax=Demequina sp. TaxID=2050685 RepID=UPI0025D30B54|nr:sodium-translocating pyrophosphatase [Demequina sp.]
MHASTTAVEVSSGSAMIVVVIGVIAAISLIFAWVLRRQVLATKDGTERMNDIATAVQEGASAYLSRQLRTLALFVVLVFALLFLLPGDAGVRVGRSLFFLLGAGCSATIGYMGMWLAVRANVRVASASTRSGGRAEGARIAFRTGGAVGMSVVGMGLGGAAAVVFLYRDNAAAVLEGFGFGAALLAMFMRVGGGIFTKAADVGADLVGKVENHIPEDDPRNPATIADNVGDNVGDCAGMAADLFESYAVTLVAALILGKAAFGEQGLVFPLIVTAIGALVAALGVFITKIRGEESGLKAINRGFYTSAAVGAVLAAVAAFLYLPSSFSELVGTSVEGESGDPRIIATVAVFVGIGLAGLILWLTGYFTDTASKPTRRVARTSLTGAATVVLSGIGLGLESAVYTATVIAGAIVVLFAVAGGSITLALFLVALAGCGLLTTVGVIVAMDTFGPVSDNAQGIAEMSGDVDADAAKILTDLDAVGNTTKAITKGIAIATAVLAATALFGSYSDAVAQALETAATTAVGFSYEIIHPLTLVGVIMGGATVFLFSGLAIDAVTRAAGAIVFEVRRQFREMPGIMNYTQRPDYGRVVDICTRDSLRELTTPGLLAAMAPVFVGFALGIGALAGFLAGAIGTGVLMAVFLANSGGSWDNAKKIVEDGHYGGKNSAAHEATVIGDTIGDPFKDTAGPAINPLIKVMNLVALLIAPAVVMLSYGEGTNPWLRAGIAAVAGTVAVVAVALASRRSHAGGVEREADVAHEAESRHDDGPGQAVDDATDSLQARGDTL